MNNKEFVAKLKDIATNYKTLYVMGCFGAPMTATNKNRYINNGASKNYNAQTARKNMINAASADTFGFDCVCLIKGVLWGWNGDASKIYGGAGYAINGVPDIDADSMITKCSGLSTDFSKIEIGEAVWVKGHIGVYIGDGLAVECTPSWENKVQITACNCSKNGYNRRNWTKHGKLPYITYVKEETVTQPKKETSTTTPAALTADAFSVGEIVNFAGGKQYSNSSAASGGTAKASLAKITSKYAKGKHPLHLRAVDSNGKYISGVYGWVDLAAVSKRPTPAALTADAFSVGEIVNFAGGKQYSNSSAASGGTAKASLAKVTSKYAKGKHPLHLRAVDSNGKYISGVYGWVDLAAVSKK